MRSLTLIALPLLMAACATNQPGGAYGDPAYGAPVTPMAPAYQATGSSGWTLTIENDRMRLVTPQGFSATDTNPTFTPDRQGDVYQGQNMRVTVVPSSCRLDAGGQLYPHQVTVTVGQDTFRGCGGPLQTMR